MRHTPMLFVGAAMLAVGLVAAPASWANSLTEDGITFSLTQGAGKTLAFSISGYNNSDYDGVGIDRGWDNITHLYAFSWKGLGVTGLTSPGWTSVANELNNSGGGCAGGSSGGFCLYHTAGPLALEADDSMTFTLTYTGGPVNFSAPHLKIFFMEGSAPTCTGKKKYPKCEYKKEGSLLSENIPTGRVPEPSSLLLLGAGLAGLGIWRRKAA